MYVYDARFASVKREEYRTPSIVIVSLARVRLEPPPHLAFGLAGTSPPDRFYTFVSPTLVDVRVRSCSLARSFARTAARRFCTRAVPPRPRRSIFFFFLPRRTWRQGPCVAPCPCEILSVGALSARTNGKSREGSTILSPVDICVLTGSRSIPLPCLADAGNAASADTETRYLLMTA